MRSLLLTVGVVLGLALPASSVSVTDDPCFQAEMLFRSAEIGARLAQATGSPHSGRDFAVARSDWKHARMVAFGMDGCVPGRFHGE
jgi:hypothetical protein